MPLGPDRQQPAQAVVVAQLLVLVTAGITQLVGQRRIERHVVPEADVLPRRGQLGLGTVTVPLRVDPVAGPVQPYARPHVGGEAQTQAQGAGLARGEQDADRDALFAGVGGVGIDPYALEITARLQGLAQLGHPFGVIRRTRFEGHHAFEQVGIERRVALEADLAEVVTRPALEHQFDVGEIFPGIDRQTLASETAFEETEARRLIGDTLLDLFVTTMIERGTRLQRPLRILEALQFSRRSFHPHPDGAQAHRWPRLDAQTQPGRLAGDHLAVDRRVVIPQRLQRLLCLLPCDAAVAQQLTLVTITEVADMVLDVLAQCPVAGFDPNVQLGRRQFGCRNEKKAGQSDAATVGYAHGGEC